MRITENKPLERAFTLELTERELAAIYWTMNPDDLETLSSHATEQAFDEMFPDYLLCANMAKGLESQIDGILHG